MRGGARARPAPQAAAGLTTWVHCDVGQRESQQDAALVVPGPAADVLLVVDGMGGHAAGDVAAHFVCREVERRYEAGHGVASLVGTLTAAHFAVVAAAAVRPERRGMGACAVALARDRASGEAQVAWVGDCRCWRLRRGRLELLTEDHGPTAEDVERSAYAVRVSLRGQPAETVEEAVRRATRRMRSTVYRAIGTREHEPDVRAVEVRPGDAYLLCSDGIEALPPEVLRDVLAESADPARDLVAAALALGNPEQDNATAVVARFA